MELELDIYFWLVDRSVLEDDPRNKIDIEANTVKFFKEDSQRLQSGYTIGKCMMKLKKTLVSYILTC